MAEGGKQEELKARDLLRRDELPSRPRLGERTLGRVGGRAWDRPHVFVSGALYARYRLADPWDPASGPTTRCAWARCPCAWEKSAASPRPPAPQEPKARKQASPCPSGGSPLGPRPRLPPLHRPRRRPARRPAASPAPAPPGPARRRQRRLHPHRRSGGARHVPRQDQARPQGAHPRAPRSRRRAGRAGQQGSGRTPPEPVVARPTSPAPWAPPCRRRAPAPLVAASAQRGGCAWPPRRRRRSPPPKPWTPAPGCSRSSCRPSFRRPWPRWRWWRSSRGRAPAPAPRPRRRRPPERACPAGPWASTTSLAAAATTRAACACPAAQSPPARRAPPKASLAADPTANFLPKARRGC